jgi:hypothetical protein
MHEALPTEREPESKNKFAKVVPGGTVFLEGLLSRYFFSVEEMTVLGEIAREMIHSNSEKCSGYVPYSVNFRSVVAQMKDLGNRAFFKFTIKKQILRSESEVEAMTGSESYEKERRFDVMYKIITIDATFTVRYKYEPVNFKKGEK